MKNTLILANSTFCSILTTTIPQIMPTLGLQEQHREMLLISWAI